MLYITKCFAYVTLAVLIASDFVDFDVLATFDEYGYLKKLDKDYKYFNYWEIGKWAEDTLYYKIDTVDLLMKRMVDRFPESGIDGLQINTLQTFVNSQLEFIKMISFLTGTEITYRNSEYVDFGYLYADHSRFAIDSLYNNYQKYRDNFNSNVIYQYVKMTSYIYLDHEEEHFWHKLGEEDKCPTYDSIRCELLNLRNTVMGIPYRIDPPKGYSLLEDSTISDSEKIERLEWQKSFYWTFHRRDSREEIEQGQASLQHAIDSLHAKNNPITLSKD